LRPSGETRVSVPRRISTRSTLPSEHQTGPSGNWSPDAISRYAGTRYTPGKLCCGGARAAGL
jgi:hypothetical protein